MVDRISTPSTASRYEFVTNTTASASEHAEGLRLLWTVLEFGWAWVSNVVLLNLVRRPGRSNPRLPPQRRADLGGLLLTRSGRARCLCRS
jgi:hypothetical protein